MKEVFTYDDLLLVPQYSDIRSREEVSIETDLDDRIHLTIPVIASPMDTVSEEDTAVSMGYAGGVAVIHRYNSIEEQTGIIATPPALPIATAVSSSETVSIGEAMMGIVRWMRSSKSASMLTSSLLRMSEYCGTSSKSSYVKTSFIYPLG